MEAIVKIKCPNCGVVLSVKNMPGIEAKNIPCPVCKMVSKFTEFKKPVVQPKVDSQADAATQYGQTEPVDDHSYAIGKLRLVGANKTYDLRAGTNVIGRKASSSSADVQIDTRDMTMSRSHSQIEVKRLASGEYVHRFSNAGNKNDTFIDNQKVENGDVVLLSGGETIKMANVVLRFVITQN